MKVVRSNMQFRLMFTWCQGTISGFHLLKQTIVLSRTSAMRKAIVIFLPTTQRVKAMNDHFVS